MIHHPQTTMTTKFLLYLSMAFTLLLHPTIFAQGSLMIFPSRLVFEGARRFEVLGVTNVGADTTTYALSFVQYRMTETGEFVEITAPDSGQKFADSYLRIFPRQVVLPPQETQSVRVQLQKPADMSAGEYRSHLLFRSVPKTKELGSLQGGSEDGKFTFELSPVYGITIPVIIRHKTTGADLRIANAGLAADSTGRHILQFECFRDGDTSAYFDIKATHVGADGKSLVVMEQKGFGIYTPNKMRRFSLPLQLAEPGDFSTGKIVLELSNGSDLKKDVLTQAEILPAGKN